MGPQLTHSWVVAAIASGAYSLELEMVLANGTSVDVSATNPNPDIVDLFWALRGGGGGNFGVVTSLTLSLHRLPSAQILTGQVCWIAPVDEWKLPLVRYNTWVQTLPNEMAAYALYITNFSFLQLTHEF